MLKRVAAVVLALVLGVIGAGQALAAESLISIVPNGVDTYSVVLTRETAPATMLNIALTCTPTADPDVNVPAGWGSVAGVNFVRQPNAVVVVMGNTEAAGMKIPAGVIATVYASDLPEVSYTYKLAPTSMQFAASGSSIVEYVLGIEAFTENEISLVPGTKRQLETSVLPKIATNTGITWKSDNDAIATVDNTGLVTAQNDEGEANITATTEDGGYSVSCKVTVAHEVIHVTGISLDKEILELKVGEKDKLQDTVYPENASDKGVKWLTGNPDVAKVEDGLVEALSAGETEITAMTVDGEYIAKCKVIVTANAEPVVPDEPDQPTDPDKPTPTPDGGNDGGGGGCNAGMTWLLLIAIAPALLFSKKK